MKQLVLFLKSSMATLSSHLAHRMHNASPPPPSTFRYAVFGLGSRTYPNFCTFAHTCDNLLKDLGAEQICLCGEGNELCGQEESFQFWLRQCYLVSVLWVLCVWGDNF